MSGLSGLPAVHRACLPAVHRACLLVAVRRQPGRRPCHAIPPSLCRFGPIVFCKLYPSKIPTRMCYCIVEFKRPDAAAAALEALDRCVWEEVSQHPLRVKFREI